MCRRERNSTCRVHNTSEKSIARVIANKEDTDTRAFSSLYTSGLGRYRTSLIDCPSRLPRWYPGETGRNECVPCNRAFSRAYNRTVP